MLKMRLIACVTALACLGTMGMAGQAAAHDGNCSHCLKAQDRVEQPVVALGFTDRMAYQGTHIVAPNDKAISNTRRLVDSGTRHTTTLDLGAMLITASNMGGTYQAQTADNPVTPAFKDNIAAHLGAIGTFQRDAERSLIGGIYIATA